LTTNKYTILVEFEVYDKTQNEAEFKLQHFLRMALIHFGLDKEIPNHDIKDQLTLEPLQEPYHRGRRIDDTFEGVPI
jgi:hypothetical protein